MLIGKLLVNENLLNAEFALNQANSDNIIKLCRAYLLVLNEYRDELYKLRGTPEINLQQSSLLARELTELVRKAIRSALEITTRERNLTENLLESFTSIGGYEAVETFNQLKYKGFNNWEMRASGIRLKDNAESEKKLTIEEAVETTSLLRREAYLEQKITFFRSPVKVSATLNNTF
ncbi:MAG: hypothetical protein ABJA66_16550 [Actinomycetota bacterium]